MKCIYCGGTEFFEGPSGGMSTNVLCANEKCRHWFNASAFSFDDLHRTEPTDAEKATAKAEAENNARTAFQERYNEGRQTYLNGISIGVCACANNNRPEKMKSGVRNYPAYGGYAEPASNIDSLVGYIEAMAQDIRKTIKRLDEITEDLNRSSRPIK